MLRTDIGGSYLVQGSELAGFTVNVPAEVLSSLRFGCTEELHMVSHMTAAGQPLMDV